MCFNETYKWQTVITKIKSESCTHTKWCKYWYWWIKFTINSTFFYLVWKKETAMLRKISLLLSIYFVNLLSMCIGLDILVYRKQKKIFKLLISCVIFCIAITPPPKKKIMYQFCFKCLFNVHFQNISTSLLVNVLNHMKNL